MTRKIPAGCSELLARQDGVIGRSQALEFGLSAYSMRHRARTGEWQRIQRGVYATFSGEVTRDRLLWAALLRAGPEAVLSHQICRAIGGQLTTAVRLRLALKRRKRFHDRREAESALGDAGQGALSNLERWYLRDVERRHKLPVATRQARFKVGGQSIYLDNLYEDYLVCVELDGTAAHPAGEQWRDKRRDRRNLAAEKIVTMRFGYLDLCTQEARCRTAGEVVGVLRERGPRVGAGCRLEGCPV